MREALHAQAQRLGIEAAIDFRHDVWEQKDVYALMKAARVAVFPTSREGFGIAVLEAIACGLPVVTTSAPDNLAAAPRGTVLRLGQAGPCRSHRRRGAPVARTTRRSVGPDACGPGRVAR